MPSKTFRLAAFFASFALAACSADDPNTSPSGSGGSASGTGGASGGGLGTGGDSATGGASGGTGGGSGGLATGGSASGGAAPALCPEDAYFCTGFEDAGIPSGATYYPTHLQSTWSSFMKMQTTSVKNGAQALEVTGAAGYMWNLLAVPVDSSTFWARFYVKSTLDIGQAEHNSYVAAMTGNGDANQGDNMEVSEQYCQMVLNLHDKVKVSVNGSESCGTGAPPLAKDAWHCVEAFFDGPNGVVQVYADKAKVIDTTGWEALDYKTFGFGYFGFHGPARTLWYDDIAVGPTRPGCP